MMVVETMLDIPNSFIVSTFIKLTLDPVSIWNPGIRAPPIITSTVGAPGSLLKVMSCTVTGLGLLRTIDELRELRHCGATANNCFIVIVGCNLSKSSIISYGLRSLDNIIVRDDRDDVTLALGLSFLAKVFNRDGRELFDTMGV